MADTPDAAIEEETETSEKQDDVHARAMRRFSAAVLPQIETRRLALEARRFVSIPGAQWEGEFGEAFQNTVRLEIDKVAAGLDKIVRDYRANRIVPDFRPAGGNSDQETADTLDGMHRADSYKFKSQQARDNAFEEAAAGGMGAYRLTNEWDDRHDKDNDHQRINPALIIVDADQRVFFDPNSKLYDKSDARYCFVLTATTPDAYEEDYEEAAPSSWPEGLPKVNYDWFTADVVMIAEYYELDEKREKLWIMRHSLTGAEKRIWASDIDPSEMEEMEATGWSATSRMQPRPRVRKYTLNGEKVLSGPKIIAGSLIPVVPVYGKRWYIDNQERFCGYVQKKMDSQRSYNAAVSRLTEIDSTAPREKPIFAPEQVPPEVGETWARQDVDRKAYALAEPLRNQDGSIAIAGPTGWIKPPDVPQVTAIRLQIASADLTADMADADEVKANTSADAMDIAATRIDAKSALYLDNMKQSVQREGEIYLSMAEDIYWEPGREVETMSEDGDDGLAKLGEEVSDPKEGLKLRNDFSAGKFKVIADVTEATATRRDKTAKSMLGLAEVCVTAQDAEGAQAAIITAAMNMDGEGLDDFQKWNRQRALKLGLVQPNEEEQKEIAQAQQQQQPDPTQALVMATAQEKQASAQLKGAQAQETQAKTVEAMASAQLKGAQAQAVGGPAAAPSAPDGLEQVGKVIDIRHKLAQTQHLQEQTALMPHEQAIEAHRAETQRLQARRAISARGNSLGG